MNDNQINFEEGPWELRITWDNRKVKKSAFVFWFMVIFLVIWFPLTCFATVSLFSPGTPKVFLAFWSLMAWLGTFVIIYSLLMRLSSQWIELDADKISWGWKGPFGEKKKSLPLSAIDELALGLYSNRYDHESMVTLNLYENPDNLGIVKAHFNNRHLLAYWLSAENKKEIFNRMSNYITDNRIELKVTTYE